MQDDVIIGRGLSRGQSNLAVGIVLGSWFVALAVFIFVHPRVLCVVVFALGVAVYALLARGFRIVVDQEGGTVGGRRATHRELDKLYFRQNAGQLRGALRVLGRWRGDGPAPGPTDAAALGMAGLPDDHWVELEQKAWSMVAAGREDGSMGPKYYVEIDGGAAVRVGRGRSRKTGRRCYLVPTELRRPPHRRAYLELMPERAKRVA